MPLLRTEYCVGFYVLTFYVPALFDHARNSFRKEVQDCYKS